MIVPTALLSATDFFFSLDQISQDRRKQLDGHVTFTQYLPPHAGLILKVACLASFTDLGQITVVLTTFSYRIGAACIPCRRTLR